MAPAQRSGNWFGVLTRVRDPISGYTHLGGFVVGCVAVVALLVRSRNSDVFFPTVAYAVTLVLLYAASSAYHLVLGSKRLTGRLRKLDHSAIFLFIAGTCTPVFWRAFQGTTRHFMLTTLWVLAVVGVVMRIAWMGAPRVLYTAMYVAMGWLVLVKGTTAFRALPALALSLVVAGGVTYTIGAIVYATKKPNPFPRLFGFHEIWHLFVLGGSTLHYAAIFVLG